MLSPLSANWKDPLRKNTDKEKSWLLDMNMREEKKKRLMNKGLEQESVKNKQTMKRIQGSDGQQKMPNITCKIIHVFWLHVNYIETLINHL